MEERLIVVGKVNVCHLALHLIAMLDLLIYTVFQRDVPMIQFISIRGMKSSFSALSDWGDDVWKKWLPSFGSGFVVRLGGCSARLMVGSF